MDIEDFPNICICGPDSDAERYLDFLYNCITDTEGNPVCNNRAQKEPEWIHYLNNGPDLLGPQDPVPKGAKEACSGSCLDPEDCNVGNDCLCASDKGMCFKKPFLELDSFCLCHPNGSQIMLCLLQASPIPSEVLITNFTRA